MFFSAPDWFASHLFRYSVLTWLIVLAVPLFSQAFAQDGGRLALVLENNGSQSAADAKAALAQAGYSVVDPGVVNRDGMGWAVDIFRRKLQRMGPGSVAIIYVQARAAAADGITYILPTPDAPATAADLPMSGFPLNDLFGALSDLPDTDVAIVLDICASANGAGTSAPNTPLPKLNRILVADCRGSDGPLSMAGDFASAMLTPGLTLAEIIEKTDRGGPSDTTSVATTAGPTPATPAPTPSSAWTGETLEPDNSLETVLWTAIKDTEDESVLQEYLQRFPDGRYVAEATVRLAALQQPAAQSPAAPPTDTKAAGPETAGDAAVGGKIASVTVTERKKADAGNSSLAALSPRSDGTRFTGTLAGTDATGWGNLYKNDCGSVIGYRLILTKTGDTWQADMTREKDGMAIRFRQRERPRDNGVVLLYAASEGAKVTLMVRPGHSERATYSIPTAGIGACATGYIY